MSDSVSPNPPAADGKRSFAAVWACALLAGLMLVAWLIDAIVVSRAMGRSVWGISALAAGICWFGATTSLVLLHVMRLRGSPIAGLLIGMVIRMTIPLFIALMATIQHSGLAEAGLAGQLVVFYLLSLAIETVLSLVLAKSVPRVTISSAVSSSRSPAHG